MWVPSGVVFIVVGLALFAKWLRESDKRLAHSSLQAALDTGKGKSSWVFLRGRDTARSSWVGLHWCWRPTGARGRGFSSESAGATQASASDLMIQYGCPTCHVIPHVPGAVGKVGPSLEGLSQRSYVAGTLQNTPENLIHWLQIHNRYILVQPCQRWASRQPMPPASLLF